MRNVYSCSIKICGSGFSELLESIFCLLLFVEVFPCKKNVEMLEEVVVSWPEVRWISGKESACRQETTDPSPREGSGNPLQDSCLGNPTDSGAWGGTGRGVSKSRTQLRD